MINQDSLALAFWAEVQTGLPICMLFYVFFIFVSVLTYKLTDLVINKSQES